MDSQSLLKQAIEKAGGPAALAREIPVSQPTISQMRDGKFPVSPFIAARCAEIVGSDPVEAMLQAEADKESGARRSFWLRLLRRAQDSVNVAVLAAVIGSSTFSPQIRTLERTGGYIHYAAIRSFLARQQIQLVYWFARRRSAFGALRLAPCF